MSIQNVQPIAAARQVATERSRVTRFPRWLHRTLNQILYITPLFWFMELFQNWIYKKVLGHYGWGYPDAAGQMLLDASGQPCWYSLRSLPLWGVTVIVFATLEPIFARHKLPFVWRLAIAGVVGWTGEWTAGFLSKNILHAYLQLWPGTTLVYVSISALPLWALDFWFFHRLTQNLRFAHEHRRARARLSGGGE